MPRSLLCTCLLAHTQLDKLRAIIENMLASSSTLLSLSMAPHKTLSTLEPGQIDPEATCPACSLDLSHQVSTLVQRYEQLQDMVNNLAASRPSKKAKLQSQVTPAGPPSWHGLLCPTAGSHSPETHRPRSGSRRLTGLTASLPRWRPLLTPHKSLVLSLGHSEGRSRTSSGDMRPWRNPGSVGMGPCIHRPRGTLA